MKLVMQELIRVLSREEEVDHAVEAEREKEDEERRVESGGGNPNDSMDMLPIPKLKF